MQGSKKIQDARCIEQISGPDFLADAADRRFSIFAGRSKMVRCKEAKKSRTRGVLSRYAVWIFSLTPQIAVFQSSQAVQKW